MNAHQRGQGSRHPNPVVAVIQDLRSVLEERAKRDNFQVGPRDEGVVLSQIEVDPAAYAEACSIKASEERINKVRLTYFEVIDLGNIKRIDIEIDSTLQGSSMPNKLVLWELYEDAVELSELTTVLDNVPKKGRELKEEVTSRPLLQTDATHLRLLVNYLWAQ